MSSFLIKKSQIHGMGVFTKESIEKNTPFYKIPITTISNKPRPRWAYIGQGRWVSDEEVLNYVNHSCNPNTILDLSDKPRLIAKRDIKVDEEITVDYNKTEENGENVPCDCGSSTCRHYFLRIE